VTLSPTINDVPTFSKTPERHDKQVRYAIESLSKAGLYLDINNCQFDPKNKLFSLAPGSGELQTFDTLKYSFTTAPVPQHFNLDTETWTDTYRAYNRIFETTRKVPNNTDTRRRIFTSRAYHESQVVVFASQITSIHAQFYWPHASFGVSVYCQAFVHCKRCITERENTVHYGHCLCLTNIGRISLWILSLHYPIAKYTIQQRTGTL
jgi:hypothetical protein